MENPIKMDDLGGKPTFPGNIHMRRSMYGLFTGKCSRFKAWPPEKGEMAWYMFPSHGAYGLEGN